MFQVNEKLALTFGGQYLGDRYERRHSGRRTTTGSSAALSTTTSSRTSNAKLAVNYTDGDSYEAADEGSFGGFLRLDASF